MSNEELEAVVTAKVWTGVGEPGFVYPELRTAVGEGGLPGLLAKEDFAVCISGGGHRAAVNALGYVRALHNEVQVLKHARYLCSNSGGSWFNTAFSYRPESAASTESFLGKYVLPENLELHGPDSGLPESGSFGYVVGKSTLKSDYTKDLLWDKIPLIHHHTIHAWSRALGHEFFAPFGEDDADDHLRYSYAIAAKAEAGAASEHPQEKRALDARGVRRVLTACREDDMPYPVMVGAVAVPTEARQFRPFEFTPQYAGVPATMQTVEGTETKLGGTFVEPIGVNSSLPNKVVLPAPNGPPELVELDRKWNVPVVQAAGISSSFIACGAPTESILSLVEHPELVTFASDGPVSQPAKMGFADGGGVDNLGVHAALRRNVKKLLVCVASGEDPSLQAQKGTLGAVDDVSGLFGACTIDVKHVGRGPNWQISKKDWNESLQCFEKGKFKEMMDALKDTEKRFETQPISCRLKLTVIPNPTQGIAGGYEADVLFLFNSMPSDWKKQLPAAARKFVEKKHFSSLGPLDTWTFPYVSTFELEWSPQLVGLSSNLCADNMKKVRADERYRDFFQFADSAMDEIVAQGISFGHGDAADANQDGTVTRSEKAAFIEARTGDDVSHTNASVQTRTAAEAGLAGGPPATRRRRMGDDV